MRAELVLGSCGGGSVQAFCLMSHYRPQCASGPHDCWRASAKTAGAWPLLGGIDVDGEIDGGLPVASLDAQTEREVPVRGGVPRNRSEEHTSELQSPCNLVC